MRKLIIFVAVVISATAGASSVAGAGEWNPGRGYIFSPPSEAAGAHSNVHLYENDDTAVGPAASECAFSGRDDTDGGDNGLWASTPAKGRVQSPGQATIAFGGPPLAGVGCGPHGATD